MVVDRDVLTVAAPKGTAYNGKKKHAHNWYQLEVESDTTYGDPEVLNYDLNRLDFNSK